MPKPLTLPALNDILAEYIPGTTVTTQTDLADLPIDSLDRLEIALHIEVHTNLDTPPDAEQAWATVQDILDTYSL